MFGTRIRIRIFYFRKPTCKKVSSDHRQDTESVKLEDTVSHDAQILRKEALLSCHHDSINNTLMSLTMKYVMLLELIFMRISF